MKRNPRLKAGRLQAFWNSRERDLYFNHGEGIGKCDAYLLNGHLTMGLMRELEKRGYDLDTLRFSVDKKEKACE